MNATTRRCFRKPVPEIYAAAEMLGAAVDAHQAGDRAACHELISKANYPVIREWAAPFLGASSRNPFLKLREPPVSAPILAKEKRVPVRMPTTAEKAALIERQGYTCAFCEIPLVRAEVRKALHAAYPEAAVWGRTNDACHAALLCMWLQYDHVLPHSRGGDNSLENIVVTCAPCNYGRMSYTLEEVGLEDPRQRLQRKAQWDGLERFLSMKSGSVPYRSGAS